MLNHKVDYRVTSIKHFFVVFLLLISMFMMTTNATDSDFNYTDSIPCDFVNELEFNETSANNSIKWQTDLGPRLPGSDNSQVLRDSIIENLSDWSFTEDPHQRENFTLTNLIGKYSPLNSTGKNVVFVAHYDTRYMADRDHNQSLQSEPILGANDGASGVAILIELGKIIPSMNLTHDVTLLFTDAEDQGQPFVKETWSYGAQAWVENLSSDYKDNISAYIVIDMVGDEYLDFTRLKSTSSKLWDTVDPIAAALGMIENKMDCQGNLGNDIYNPDSNAARSVIDDHLAAHESGIPAINIIDINYGLNASAFGGHWHTHNDTADKVSSNSLRLVGSILELGLRSSSWDTEEIKQSNNDTQEQSSSNDSDESSADSPDEKSQFVGYFSIAIVSVLLIMILIADISLKM
tara:strand:- start:131 stop:1348 length:1218 start_codon:yes stop_codon:yes gene_type:complete